MLNNNNNNDTIKSTKSTIAAYGIVIVMLLGAQLLSMYTVRLLKPSVIYNCSTELDSIRSEFVLKCLNSRALERAVFKRTIIEECVKISAELFCTTSKQK